MKNITIEKGLEALDEKIKEKGFYESYDDRTAYTQIRALWRLLLEKNVINEEDVRKVFDNM